MAIESVASFESSATAVDIATHVAERLEAEGHRCGRVIALDGSATFSTKVRRLSMLIVVYPDGPDPGHWVLTLGPVTLPSARLVGMTDDTQRSAIGAKVAVALDGYPSATSIRWHTDEAWAAMRPLRVQTASRRWWRRGTSD